MLLAVAVGLTLESCDQRGDLLGVELAVIRIGEWHGFGPEGEELVFVLDHDGDDVILTSFGVSLPGLLNALFGQPEACDLILAAFSTFGNGQIDVPVRDGAFRFRTPGDFRFDNDGLIRSEVVGRFDAAESGTVDAEIEIDATRFGLPCRGEFTVSWQVAPTSS